MTMVLVLLVQGIWVFKSVRLPVNRDMVELCPGREPLLYVTGVPRQHWSAGADLCEALELPCQGGPGVGRFWAVHCRSDSSVPQS